MFQRATVIFAVLLCSSVVAANEKSVFVLTQVDSDTPKTIEVIIEVLDQELSKLGVNHKQIAVTDSKVASKAERIFAEENPLAVIWYDDKENAVYLMCRSDGFGPETVVRPLREEMKPTSIAETAAIIVREQVSALLSNDHQKRAAAPDRKSRAHTPRKPERSSEKKFNRTTPEAIDAPPVVNRSSEKKRTETARKQTDAPPNTQSSSDKAPEKQGAEKPPSDTDISPPADKYPDKDLQSPKRLRAWFGYALSFLYADARPLHGATVGFGGSPSSPLVIVTSYTFLAPRTYEDTLKSETSVESKEADLKIRMLGHRGFFGIRAGFDFRRVVLSGTAGVAFTYLLIHPESDTPDLNLRRNESIQQVSIPIELRVSLKLNEFIGLFFSVEGHVSINPSPIQVNINDSETDYLTQLRVQPTILAGGYVAFF